MRRISMREIAKKAGVSLATVSYALRGHKKIPEQTRKHIKKIADQLGYQPDPSFAVLGARRWEKQSTYNGLSIAYVTGPRNEWTYFQKQCFLGCQDQAKHLGYKLDYFNINDYDSPTQLGEVLEHRAYTGVIFRRINNQEDINGFPLNKFSVIACGRGHVDPGCHIVMPHHHYNVQTAWKYMHDKGHDRIGFILLEENPLAELPEFYTGAIYAMQEEVKKTERIPPFICRDHDKKRLAEWIKRWQPQSIIGCVEHIETWLSSHRKLSGQAPEFIPLEKSSPRSSRNSGIDLRPHLMGSIAVDQLDRAIRDNERGLPEIRQTILIESAWNL